MEDTLSEELLQGRVSLGQEVRLTVKDGEITLDDPSPAKPEPAEVREEINMEEIKEEE